MAIKASEVTSASSLEEFRREFNKLVNDVTDIKNNNIFGTSIYFEGSSEDAYETQVTVTNPTADRTITIPNETGTLITSGSSISSTTILVTDNESTNEENAVVFVADAEKDGTGQRNLESDGTLTYNPSSGTLTATTFSGAMSGNADTATALATGRNFSITGDVTAAAVSFDGTGNVALSAGSVLATNATITANNSADETVYPVFVDGATGTQGLESDTGLTYNPNSGVLTTTSVTGNLTGNVTGNADTATALASGRTIGMTGDVVWTSASFDGTGNVTGTATIQANSVALGTDTTGAYISTISGTSNEVEVTGSGSETATVTIGLPDDVTIGDDLTLGSDGAILNFGTDSDVSLTHVADTGLLLNGTMQLQFNDASQNINAPSATVLDINATDEIELNATLADINANLDVSGTYTGGGLMTTGGNIVIPNGGNIGTVSDTDSITIASSGEVTLDRRSTHTAGITIANDAQIGSAGDGDSMAINSSGVVTFSQRPVFNNGGITIPNDGQIGSVGDADALTIDSSGNVTASQNFTITGDLTVNGGTVTNSATNTVIEDALIELNTGASSNSNDLGFIMERGSTGNNAFMGWDEGSDIFAVGTTTATGASTGSISYTLAPFHASTLTGTLQTAAQTNITSVGTLSALTVDNIQIDGTNIGHTSDTDAIEISSGGIVTFSQRDVHGAGITIQDGGQIGSSSDTDAISIAGDGVVTFSQRDVHSGGITVSDGGQIGSSSATNAFSIAASGVTTFNFRPIFNVGGITLVNDGQIGSVGDADAMEINSSGVVNFSQRPTFSNSITIQNGGEIGSAGDTDAMNINSSGVVTFTQRDIHNSGITIANGGEIGSVGDGDAMAIASDGVVTFSQIPVMSAGLNVSGGTITGTIATASQTNITGVGALNAGSISSGFGNIDTGSSTITTTGNITGGTLTSSGNVVIANAGNIGSVGDTDAIAIASDGKTTFSQQATFSNGIKFPDNGTIDTATTSNLITLMDDSVRIQNASTDDAQSMLQLYSTDSGSGSSPDMLWWRNSSSPADNDYIGKMIFMGQNDADQSISYATQYAQILDVTDGTEDGRFVFSALSNGAYGYWTMGSTGAGTGTLGITIPNGSYIGSGSDPDAMSITSSGIVEYTQGVHLTGDEKELRWYNGSNYVGFAAHSSLAGNQIWKLPTADASSNGDALVSDGSGNLSFSATVGSNASTVTLVATNTTDATHYPLFSDAATGNENPRTDTGFTYNPSTGILTSTGYAGTLQTAAQTNITSVGTLSGLTIADGGNIGSASDTDALSIAADGKITVKEDFLPDGVGGAVLGNNANEWGGLFLKESAVVNWGNDQDVSITHDPDSGLKFKHTDTADDSYFTLTLQTGDTDIAADDIISKIDFQAPSEGAGSDAILVAASISAVSEGDFSASNNATKLEFSTGISEAATPAMALSSTGSLSFPNKEGGDNLLLDSTNGTADAGDDVILNGTDGSSSNANSNIIFEDAVALTTQTDRHIMKRMMGEFGEEMKSSFPNRMRLIDSTGATLRTLYCAGDSDGS